MVYVPSFTRISTDGSRTESQGEHTNDASLPSYQCMAYRKFAPLLETSMDVYEGITAWVVNDEVIDSHKACRYLPQEEKESDDAYRNRLLRSLFINFYRPAITGFSGLLSDFELNQDIHPSLTQYEDNVDLQGNSITAFFASTDKAVMRDGFVGVLIEFPEGRVDDAGQEAAAGDRRPYLILVERSNIINWRWSTDGAYLEQLTIRRVEVRQEDRFGEKEVTVYQVWTPGRYEIWEQEEDGDVEFVSESTFSLSFIPFVPYSVSEANPFESRPPLYDLALQNIAHYQELSDDREVRHKCNLPVPVRKGYMGAGGINQSGNPPLVIGPNSVVDVPPDGDFYFREPSGVAIASNRTAIMDLEERMLKEALSFFGGEGIERTAREVELRSSQTRASLSLLAHYKESAVQRIFKVWSLWMNSDQFDGGITINKSLLSSPLEPSAIQVFSNLVTLGQLPVETFWQILKEGKRLPKSIDVDELVNQSSPETPLNPDSEVLNG
ncbi:MAG: DUF4055 domain-containing protein [Cyanobacteria bacterium J06633_2]